MAKIMNLMVGDVLEEIRKDRANEIEAMDEKQLRFLQEFITSAVKAFFRLKTRRLNGKNPDKNETIQQDMSAVANDQEKVPKKRRRRRRRKKKAGIQDGISTVE